jgi:hypothetical protein
VGAAPLPVTVFPGAFLGGPFPLAQGPIGLDGNMEYLGSFRLRLGYAVDRLLLYSTLGMAWTHDTVTIVTPVAIPFNFSSAQTHSA